MKKHQKNRFARSNTYWKHYLNSSKRTKTKNILNEFKSSSNLEDLENLFKIKKRFKKSIYN